MILSCCFRNTNSSKKQKHKGEEAQSTLLEQYDSEPQRPRPGPGSRRNSGESFKSLKSQAQEKHPSRIEKRIQKQRSQDSIQSQHQPQQLSAVGGSSQSCQPQVYQHRFRKTSSNVSQGQQRQERCQSQSLPSPPATPKLEIGTKRFSAGGNLHSPAHDVKIEQQQQQCQESSQKRSVSCQAFRSRESISCGDTGEHEASQDKLSSPEVISIQRSSQAPNQFNQNISDATQEALAIKEQEIVAVREQYEAMIQKMKSEHSFALNQAREIYDSQMRDELNKHKKDVQEAVLNANNRANETITNLNKEIALEKSKQKEEHEEVVRKLSVELKDKEGKIQEAFVEIEQREQSWQDDKEDVLREIQRLKAEASKMVSILAAEYEEENLSEEKKRSLSAEVYSLQLVVEMRTAEVRGLREKLATSQQQLEDAAVTRNSLQKAHARIEDLKEQLKKKVEQEQRAAAEKWELESSVSESNKVAERMSMNVEELQWRIRNNYELPVGIFANKLVERDAVSDKKSEDTDHISDNIATDRVQASNRNQFSVSREMMEATSTDESPAVGDDAAVRMTAGVSDASPSSDICLEYDVIRANEEANQEEQSDGNNNLNDDGDDDIVAEESIDRDSLDEGLGDISSDGEVTAETPELKNHDIDNNNQEDEAAVLRAKTNAVPDLVTDRLSSETEKERRPSRISFETPL